MHEDLLHQAEQLANLDVRKPRQANLRRAVSAAYYAAFHALVHDACCASFGGGTLKSSVRKGLPVGFAIPAAIQNIATTFAELQEKRHLADYDLTERFVKYAVEGLLADARQSIADFKALPASNEKHFFLACLWAWKELSNR